MTKALIGSEFFEFTRQLVDAARFTVDVAMYDWRWYADEPTHPMQQLNTALVRALRRGVKVRMIWQHGISDTQAHEVGFTCKARKLRRTLHAKVVLVDGKFVCAGSHNFTGNAARHNHELSLATDDPESVERCARWFDTLFNWN